MATKTFSVDRVGGGTFELIQDATTGKYSLKKVGFAPVKSLTIPDYSATTATTSGSTDTSKAVTQATKDTTKLFNQDNRDKDLVMDYTGQMLKKQRDLTSEAAKIDPQLPMTRNQLTDSFIGEEKPTKTYSEQLKDLQSAQKEQGTSMYQDAILRGEAGVKGESKRPGITVDKTSIRPFGAFDVTPKSQMRKSAEVVGASGADKAAMTSDDAALGIQRVPIQQGTFTKKSLDQSFAGEEGKTARVPDAIITGQKGIDPEPTALKKVNTGLKSLGQAVSNALDKGVIAAIAGFLPKTTLTPTQKLNESYFNTRGKGPIMPGTPSGRIAGNPAKDLYAGMNIRSDFGNLERGGDKRIATRETTGLAKMEARFGKNHPRVQAFKEQTQKFKDQASKYKAKKQKANQGPAGGATTGGGGGGKSDSGRVICTELHKTGELSTIDWIRDIKFTYGQLSKKHVMGYLAWAVPTVRHIKKYPTYRKIWKHIAQHRANDIAWRLRLGKFDLLGRIYAGIGEPLCWIIGNFVSDKKYNELHHTGKRYI